MLEVFSSRDRLRKRLFSLNINMKIDNWELQKKNVYLIYIIYCTYRYSENESVKML